MSLSADIIRGHTETIILSCLSCGDSYGYNIGRDIKKHTDGAYEPKEATLYTAFRRLEQGGLISSYWGDGDSGARRRYYSITDEGKQSLTKSIDQWQQAKGLLDRLIVNREEK